jgi:hypothetical protein
MAKKKAAKKASRRKAAPKFARGTMVFWLKDAKPWWIVEWQDHNGIGGSYWITNYIGTSGGACENELSLFPGEAPVLRTGY